MLTTKSLSRVQVNERSWSESEGDMNCFTLSPRVWEKQSLLFLQYMVCEWSAHHSYIAYPYVSYGNHQSLECNTYKIKFEMSFLFSLKFTRTFRPTVLIRRESTMTFKALWVPVEKVQVKWKEKMIIDDQNLTTMHECMQSHFSHVQLFATLWTVEPARFLCP